MSTPAGWYPQDDGRQRYWDGTQWTEHFAPGAAAGVAAGATAVGDTTAYSYTTPVGADGGLATGAYPAANTAAAQRPWFKKKRFLIPGGAVALILVASMASAASGGGSTPEPTSAAAGLLSASSTPTATARARRGNRDTGAHQGSGHAGAEAGRTQAQGRVVQWRWDLRRGCRGQAWPLPVIRQRVLGATEERIRRLRRHHCQRQRGWSDVDVQIKKSDGYFSTSDMDDWVLVPTGIKGPQATKFSGDGIYMVGVDIKPGTYKASGSGYWERLRSAGGGFDGIIANDNPSGKAIVQIKKSDKFFSTSGMSDWTRVK